MSSQLWLIWTSQPNLSNLDENAHISNKENTSLKCPCLSKIEKRSSLVQVVAAYWVNYVSNNGQVSSGFIIHMKYNHNESFTTGLSGYL